MGNVAGIDVSKGEKIVAMNQMDHLIASANSGSLGFIVIDSANVDLYDSVIEVSDTAFSSEAIQWGSSGVFNFLNSRVISTSNGALGPIALAQIDGTVNLRNSSAECATAGTSACLLSSQAGTAMNINNSTLRSFDAASPVALADNNGLMRISLSQIINGAITTANGGTATCGGVTDESFTFAAAACP